MNIANRLTILRILCIPLFVVVVSAEATYGQVVIFGQALWWSRIWAMLLFVFASLTDWLDGYLARRYQLVTTFGKFADPLADKLLVITAFLMLLDSGNVPAWVVVVIVCRELAVTGLRILLVTEGEVLAAAWPGKIKTATQMLAIIFLLLNNFPFSLWGWPVAHTLLAICLLFTVYSGLDYFIKNWRVFQTIK